METERTTSSQPLRMYVEFSLPESTSRNERSSSGSENDASPMSSPLTSRDLLQSESLDLEDNEVSMTTASSSQTTLGHLTPVLETSTSQTAMDTRLPSLNLRRAPSESILNDVEVVRVPRQSARLMSRNHHSETGELRVQVPRRRGRRVLREPSTEPLMTSDEEEDDLDQRSSSPSLSFISDAADHQDSPVPTYFTIPWANWGPLEENHRLTTERGRVGRGVYSFTFMMSSDQLAQFVLSAALGMGYPSFQGQPPASEDAIKNQLFQSPGNPSLSCGICLESFGAEETMSSMACQHPFHFACLKTWLKSSNTCPHCRYEISTENEDYNRGVTRRMEAREASRQRRRQQEEERQRQRLSDLSPPALESSPRAAVESDPLLTPASAPEPISATSPNKRTQIGSLPCLPSKRRTLSQEGPETSMDTIESRPLGGPSTSPPL